MIIVYKKNDVKNRLEFLYTRFSLENIYYLNKNYV